MLRQEPLCVLCPMSQKSWVFPVWRKHINLHPLFMIGNFPLNHFERFFSSCHHILSLTHKGTFWISPELSPCVAVSSPGLYPVYSSFLGFWPSVPSPQLSESVPWLSFSMPWPETLKAISWTIVGLTLFVSHTLGTFVLHCLKSSILKSVLSEFCLFFVVVSVSLS